MTTSRKFISECLSGAIIGIGALAIAGRVFDLEALIDWGGSAQLSLPASAGFVLIGLALMMLITEKEKKP